MKQRNDKALKCGRNEHFTPNTCEYDMEGEKKQFHW
jgi:hypothetical protein